MAEDAPCRPYRVLAYDSGAIRAGWGVVDEGPTYIDSGVIHTPRPKTELFQKYRMRLAEEWTRRAIDQILRYWPDLILTETVPSRGAGIPEQLYLANVQISTVHAIAFRYGIEVKQISARTIQKAIAIRGNSRKVTKPQVRNGVLARFPELKDSFRTDTKEKVWERSDALAIALSYFEGKPDIV